MKSDGCPGQGGRWYQDYLTITPFFFMAVGFLAILVLVSIAVNVSLGRRSWHFSGSNGGYRANRSIWRLFAEWGLSCFRFAENRLTGKQQRPFVIDQSSTILPSPAFVLRDIFQRTVFMSPDFPHSKDVNIISTTPTAPVSAKCVDGTLVDSKIPSAAAICVSKESGTFSTRKTGEKTNKGVQGHRGQQATFGLGHGTPQSTKQPGHTAVIQNQTLETICKENKKLVMEQNQRRKNRTRSTQTLSQPLKPSLDSRAKPELSTQTVSQTLTSETKKDPLPNSLKPHHESPRSNVKSPSTIKDHCELAHSQNHNASRKPLHDTSINVADARRKTNICSQIDPECQPEQLKMDQHAVKCDEFYSPFTTRFHVEIPPVVVVPSNFPKRTRVQMGPRIVIPGQMVLPRSPVERQLPRHLYQHPYRQHLVMDCSHSMNYSLSRTHVSPHESLLHPGFSSQNENEFSFFDKRLSQILGRSPR